MSRCEFIGVPPEYGARFAYLHDTQLFFFAVLRKLNRLRTKGRRVCFITDYTINLAAPETGMVSRCSKVEDVEELICDVRGRAVGIRMRARPFAVQPHHYLQWNCFYEMPVDLLLFAESQEQVADLMRVLCAVYQQCTKQELPSRSLDAKEEWEATLVLWPDGSRVKKNAMLYHRVPTFSDIPAPPPRAGQTEEASQRVTLPLSRGRRSSSAPLLSSPPSRPPPSQRRPDASFPPSCTRGKQLELTCDNDTPPRTTRAAYPHMARGVVADGDSATRRRVNPLAQAWHTAGSRPACAHPADTFSEDDADTPASLYTPPTPPVQAKAARSTNKLRALEAVVWEQQLHIRELRQSRYSKECELDDLKRHLAVSTSSQEPPAHRCLIHLPEPLDVAASRDSAVRRDHHAGTGNLSTNGHTTSLLERAGSSDGSSTSSHGARLSTVKPIQGSVRKACVAEAELADALRRHREFEETVLSYYKALPYKLRVKLHSFSGGQPALRGSAHTSQPRASQHTMEEELAYLQTLVRQGRRGSEDVAVPSGESMAVLGRQLDAFAGELAQKQREIDQLRQQVRSASVVHA